MSDDGTSHIKISSAGLQESKTHGGVSAPNYSLFLANANCRSRRQPHRQLPPLQLEACREHRPTLSLGWQTDQLFSVVVPPLFGHVFWEMLQTEGIIFIISKRINKIQSTNLWQVFISYQVFAMSMHIYVQYFHDVHIQYWLIDISRAFRVVSTLQQTDACKITLEQDIKSKELRIGLHWLSY